MSSETSNRSVQKYNKGDNLNMKFVIGYGGNDPDYQNLFWSNKEGWTDYNFEVFFEEEIRMLNLGDEMQWHVYDPDAETSEISYVSAYEVERHYGGPEEGGWWFDSGTLVDVVKCFNRDQAEHVWDLLKDIYPNTGKRYSVLGGEDYSVSIEEKLIPFFPSQRPRYE